MNKTDQQGAFWTHKRLFLAHAVLLVLVVVGLTLRGFAPTSGSFMGLSISSVFIWYAFVSVLWWVILATFFVQKVKEKRSDRMPFSWITMIAAWIVTLVPAWLLFIGNLYFYVQFYVLFA